MQNVIPFVHELLLLSQFCGKLYAKGSDRMKRVISNIIFNMRSAKRWDKKLFYFQFLPVVPGVLATYLGIRIPSELVRGLENGWTMKSLMLYIFLLSMGMMLCNMLYQVMGEYIYRNSPTLTMYYETCCYEKIMKLDYELLQEPACAKLIGNTWNVLRNEYGTRASVSIVPFFLESLLSVVWYGWVIRQSSLLIIGLAIFQTLANTIMIQYLGKKHADCHKEVGKYAGQAAYISRKSMDRQSGKDIRIYNMQSWILKKYEESLKGMDGIYKKMHDGYFHKALADAVILFVLNGFAYTWLIALVGQGKITISEFVLQIGLIGSFTGALKQLMNHVLSVKKINISLEYIRSFLEMEENKNWSEGVGEEVVSRIKREGIQVELKGVSFCYPQEKEPVLADLNLEICQGEKLALIGLNGAGKTTLVKLLCGFYRPTKGEIRVNGIPMGAFSKKEYQELVTVLFQDATVLPMTMDCNLTGEAAEQVDRKRLEQALELSGFRYKYEELERKGESLLVREANKEALDFSGGERQKMLFARALYKEAPFMILDEPTAALDPIAENLMYQNFAAATEGRTCVYISHRLSSTRFCDRILLMENGRITEEGTHDGLMQRNGSYARLYELQSKYYREQEAVREEETYE